MLMFVYQVHCCLSLAHVRLDQTFGAATRECKKSQQIGPGKYELQLGNDSTQVTQILNVFNFIEFDNLILMIL